MDLKVYLFLSFLFIYIIISILILANIHRFNLKFYNLGIIIFRRNFKNKYYKWYNKDGIYQEKVGNYVFIPNMKLGYFVTRFKYFNQRSIFYISKGLPLTIFGEFCENEGRIDIVYKIFYGALVLPLILISLFVIFVIMAILKGKVALMLFGVMIIIIVLIIIYVFLLLQRGKMLVVSDEIQNLLK